MDRRELIQWLVATAGLQARQAYTPNDLLALGRDVHRHGTPHLRPTHANRTVTIAAERILPGATEANVGAFIDTMLDDWYAPEERERFLSGLKDLDTRCQTAAHADFILCEERHQMEVLATLDAEVTELRASAGDGRADQHWFAMLKFLTIYGWCTSEPGMRALQLYPLPWRYEGCAPV